MNGFDDLTALGLPSLAEVLASHAPARSDLAAGQWLGLVELLTLRLTQGIGDPTTEYWDMYSSAFGYALDSAVASGAIDHCESVIRRMNLSQVLLQKTPPNPRVELLDPDRLIELLLQELPMSAVEAGIMSADWRHLDIARIRALRVAKNLVSPGLAIARLVCEVELDRRLQEWERILPALP